MNTGDPGRNSALTTDVTTPPCPLLRHQCGAPGQAPGVWGPWRPTIPRTPETPETEGCDGRSRRRTGIGCWNCRGVGEVLDLSWGVVVVVVWGRASSALAQVGTRWRVMSMLMGIGMGMVMVMKCPCHADLCRPPWPYRRVHPPRRRRYPRRL